MCEEFFQWKRLHLAGWLRSDYIQCFARFGGWETLSHILVVGWKICITLKKDDLVYLCHRNCTKPYTPVCYSIICTDMENDTSFIKKGMYNMILFVVINYKIYICTNVYDHA